MVLLLNMVRGVFTVITLNVTSKLPPTLYLMTVPRLRDCTVCKNRDKPIKYTVRVMACCCKVGIMGLFDIVVCLPAFMDYTITINDAWLNGVLTISYVRKIFIHLMIG